jgi:hypothetical protein
VAIQSRRERRGDVQSVTTAAPGTSVDVDARLKRYLWMMGIRVACFILAIVVSGWPRWFFIAGAIVLPYLAVVVANARDSRRGPHGAVEPGAPEHLALPSRASPAED